MSSSGRRGGRTTGILLACFVGVLCPGREAAKAQAIGVVAQAQQVVGYVEQMTGQPIAVLTRNDNDLSGFYYAAMQTLCAKTGSNWCDTELYGVLTDTTNQLGWARVLTYSGNDGAAHTVCAILPPATGVSATFVATGISGGQVFDWRDLPTGPEAEAWLWMDYAGQCLQKLGDSTELKRSDAFASLALTLIEGSPLFVSAQDVTPARKFSFYRNTASTGWAVNAGERALLDLWKSQTAKRLSDRCQCSAQVVASTDLNTPAIQRDVSLPVGQNCMAQVGVAVGLVTDSNMWLWDSANGAVAPTWPAVDLPPTPYAPFQSFGSPFAGVSWAWSAADAISKQY